MTEMPPHIPPIQPETLGDLMAEALVRFRAGVVVLPCGDRFAGITDGFATLGARPGCDVVTCLEDRHSIALARGYAVAGETVGVAVIAPGTLAAAHRDLALAARDQTPLLVLILEGTDPPVDAAPLRLLRIGAAEEALEILAHAVATARCAPAGPVGIALRDEILGEVMGARPAWPDLLRRLSFSGQTEPGVLAGEAAGALFEAERAVMLIGRVERSDQAAEARLRLADALGATVIVEDGSAARFPADYGRRLDPRSAGAIAAALDAADVILSLQYDGLAGLLAHDDGAPDALVIHVSPVPLAPAGAVGQQKVAPVDIFLRATPDAAVRHFLASLNDEDGADHGTVRVAASTNAFPELGDGPITPIGAAPAEDGILISGDGPMAFVTAIGAATALRATGEDRPLAVIHADRRDVLTEATALWTAVQGGVRLAVLTGAAGAAGPDLRGIVQAYGARFIEKGARVAREFDGVSVVSIGGSQMKNFATGGDPVGSEAHD